MAQGKKAEEVLRSLLETDLKPEHNIYMKRFNIHFHIQALDGKTINKIREQASYPVKNGEKRLDEEKFGALMIEKACLVPKWTSPELLEAFGPTPADVILKRLLAGEIAKLSTEILHLSGFTDEEEVVDEIKN
ncbi:phage tail assembly chaperone [Chengkuizengella sp. SCS-71B]|uniref:phage tail assembly chaperone n=1 Tax=Chengkuizengella sp. SCS-71B TaxID=3115290 RepID=UPI0032C22AC8